MISNRYDRYIGLSMYYNGIYKKNFNFILKYIQRISKFGLFSETRKYEIEINSNRKK